jgi:hypothetical protein
MTVRGFGKEAGKIRPKFPTITQKPTEKRATKIPFNF